MVITINRGEISRKKHHAEHGVFFLDQACVDSYYFGIVSIGKKTNMAS
jgi:hypothetical protein